MRQLARSLHRFAFDQQGAMTIEFVVLLPILVLLMVLVVFGSLALGAISDVQQLTNDLARFSLRHAANLGKPTFCTDMIGVELPRLLASSVSGLDGDRVAASCVVRDVTGALGRKSIEVVVKYNFTGGALQQLGQGIGIDLGTITRRATMVF